MRKFIGNDHDLGDHKWDGADSEHEERVRGEGFHLEKYFVGFIVSDADLEWWVAAKTREAEDWAPHDKSESESANRQAKAISELHYNPLRRR
jgi:hypothetical protein